MDVIKHRKYGCPVRAETEELINLRRSSSWIGSNVSMVQGPGGNTSLKNSEFMWIKGSGTKLKDVDIAKIFLRKMLVFPSSIEFLDELLAKEFESALVTD